MGPPLSTLASYKRIIICADGTWQTSSSGDGSSPTNVAKMARAIAGTGITADGSLIKQIVYYHPGLGTGDLPLQKLIYGALGWGIENDLCQIYDFISNNYEPNDELFFFGYSRGAFIVRSVAGLVADIGILSAVNMSRFPEMWSEYQNSKGGEFRESQWYQNNKAQLQLKDVQIKVIGVWDTVGALGIPEWPWLGWLRDCPWLSILNNERYAFHNTRLSKSVDYAFQALAIDEDRFTFSPAVWHKTSGDSVPDLKQCWFPGTHTNIGGQAENPRDKGDFEGIGWNTLAWMMDNLEGMITFEGAAIESFIDGHTAALAHCKMTDGNGEPNGWGCGPIVGNFGGITRPIFWWLDGAYRTPGDYEQRPSDGTLTTTDEYFHPLLRIRKDKVTSYNGEPLSLYSPRDCNTGGREWVKSSSSKAIPEYMIRRDRKMSLAYDDHGIVKYKTGNSLAWQMCPNDIKSRL